MDAARQAAQDAYDAYTLAHPDVVGGRPTELTEGVELCGPNHRGSHGDGFCDGKFGRDGYGVKRVERIGDGWVILRYLSNGQPVMYTGAPSDLLAYVCLHLSAARDRAAAAAAQRW